ncbi:Retrovirus-related Pol polyprotein from transposon TNT 1-94 [Vitis vinifera]|uniref:Retrovirus-related Pol polyprotein from transposon TNT 1-94 n=1 Tax=Vitis vinifera TaxID=29760 RepID=A0A438IX12_VITVI|nr:Retrovirus-related Pol polyprotein from transposon TNT 1-94 [Vitis vinifera]
MDLKTAFLSEDLEKEIYIEQLEGCVIPRKKKKIELVHPSPNQDHWTIVRRVLKYLRGTINYGLCFSGFPSVLEGFSDANWISNSDEMKSTNEYVFILGGSAVSWKYAKQTCITRSTMEVDFITLEKPSSELECLRNLLADIHFMTRPTPSVFMRCDSQIAIVKAKSKIFNGMNMHIRLRHNIVR